MKTSLMIAAFAACVLSAGSVHAGSWSAEALGEGSGLDRGMFLAGASKPGGTVAGQRSSTQTTDDAALKSARREMIADGLAETLEANDARLNGVDMMGGAANAFSAQQDAVIAHFVSGGAGGGIHAVPAGDDD